MGGLDCPSEGLAFGVWGRGRGLGIRGCVGVVEDVAVFEVLGVGAHLEVLFEGFLALDGGEGRLVNGDLGTCHGVCLCLCQRVCGGMLCCWGSEVDFSGMLPRHLAGRVGGATFGSAPHPRAAAL